MGIRHTVSTRPGGTIAIRLAVVSAPPKENLSMLMTILIIVLVLALIGGLPTWPHSRSWGYGPSGGLGLILVILLVLLLLGRL